MTYLFKLKPRSGQPSHKSTQPLLLRAIHLEHLERVREKAKGKAVDIHSDMAEVVQEAATLAATLMAILEVMPVITPVSIVDAAIILVHSVQIHRWHAVTVVQRICQSSALRGQVAP